MMKRMLAFLLTLVLILTSLPALADTQPTPISKIPYDQIPENRDGIYHYLLLCMDEWNGRLHDNNGGIVLLTTALSCFTLFLWIWLLKSLGLF